MQETQENHAATWSTSTIDKQIISDQTKFVQAENVDRIKSFHLTDMGNAKRFANQHKEYARYVNTRGKWYLYNGAYWTADELDAAYQLAESTILSMYAEASQIRGDEDWRRQVADHARKSESHMAIRNMLALAETRPEIATSINIFDTDDMLFNVSNATIDLHTGQAKPHQGTDMISKVAPVTYDPNGTCFEWLTFLNRIMNNDAEMVKFLQRAVGYSLTGNTAEQCLFFLYGTGANGKSTFVETIRHLLGHYGQQAEFSSLVAKENDAVRNDIARLAGARFVAASENNAERRFDEALIKQLTGGDMIAARFLYKELFEFKPKFKLWLSGNHKPIIAGTDEGTWRRINLIPFNVTIPAHERDKRLADKLRAELPGILNWAIQGCLEWQGNGLNVPQKVIEATDAYRSEMDSVGLFMDEYCERKPSAKSLSSIVYTRYVDWCKASGEISCNQREFRRRMEEGGCEAKRQSGGVYWMNLQLSDFPI